MNSKTPQPSGPSDGANGGRILLAEDHLDSREALCALLEAFGYTVIPAENGAQAVELARQDPPDLVLMDIMMPEVDGFEATRQLRDFPETCDVPIITLTAMEGAHTKAMEAGADDFLAKPINSGQLLDKLKDWLND